MRPVTQSRVGEDGTCFRACIASILNLDEAQVTDFDGPRRFLHDVQGMDDYWANVEGFLATKGLSYRRVPVDGRKPIGYSTIEGVSPRGGLHACVAKDGVLIHDPHPQDGTGRGLVEPRYYGLLEPIRVSGGDWTPYDMGPYYLAEAADVETVMEKLGPFTIQVTEPSGKEHTESVRKLRSEYI